MSELSVAKKKKSIHTELSVKREVIKSVRSSYVGDVCKLME